MHDDDIAIGTLATVRMNRTRGWGRWEHPATVVGVERAADGFVRGVRVRLDDNRDGKEVTFTRCSDRGNVFRDCHIKHGPMARDAQRLTLGKHPESDAVWRDDDDYPF